MKKFVIIKGIIHKTIARMIGREGLLTHKYRCRSIKVRKELSMTGITNTGEQRKQDKNMKYETREIPVTSNPPSVFRSFESR
jgi:hypothetical protein